MKSPRVKLIIAIVALVIAAGLIYWQTRPSTPEVAPPPPGAEKNRGGPMLAAPEN